jgi:hypothetical protein
MTANRMVVSELSEFELYDNTAGIGLPIREQFWTQCAAFCQTNLASCKAWWIFQSPTQPEVTCFITSKVNLATVDWIKYNDLVAELV